MDNEFWDEDQTRVLSDRVVTTRKTHECSECRRPMPPGTRAYRVALINDGGDFEAFVCHFGICPSDEWMFSPKADSIPDGLEW